MKRGQRLLGFLAFCAVALGTACGDDDGDGDTTGPDTGSLLVTTATSGDTLDPDGYTVTVDGSESQAIGVNAMVSFSDLSGGDHSVELTGVAVNCAVGGDNPRMVTVTLGSTVPTTFDATCVAALFDQIAFQTDRDGNDEIYVMNPDGTGPTRLTNDAATDQTPAWSPDGTKIAFETNRDGNTEIYVINADGTGLMILTNDAATDATPAWSPDGTKLAFSTNRNGNFEIYVMNADGTGPINLSNNAASDFEPAWSPAR